MNWTDKEREELARMQKQVFGGSFGERLEESGRTVKQTLPSGTKLLDDQGVDYVSPTAPGGRNDAGKTRYDLIPPEALEGLAEVLTFGANKYADRNWEKGMKWGRVFGSLMRHLWKWWSPMYKDVDEETGFSHLAHALCNIAFLITYEQRKIGDDDRSKITS